MRSSADDLLADRAHAAGRCRPSAPSSRSGPARRAASWRAASSASRRGPCSSPGACPASRAPRTSPTMIRSGRMRSALRTRSRIGSRPRPRCSAGATRGDHVSLLELQLGRVLDRDDPLVVGDERRQHVEQRRLAGAGAAGDEDVQLAAHAAREERRPTLRRERPELDQVVDRAAGRARTCGSVSVGPSARAAG